MRTVSLTVVCFMMLSAANAQVKLAEVSGAPGAFSNATTVVFGAAGTAFVTNPGSGVVQKFRLDTGEILATLSLAPGIGQAALTPDGRTLVVSGVTSQRIYIVDVATMTLRRDVSYQPSKFTARNNIVISPDSTRIYMADPSRNQVVVIVTADGSIDRFMNVGVNPNILTPLPNGRRFAVLCSGKQSGDEESLYFVDMLSEAVVDNPILIGFNTEPFNNATVTPTGSHVFVPAYNDNRIWVYDLKNFVQGGRSSGGTGPSKAVISPNGRIMAVLNTGSANVALFSSPEALPIRDENGHEISISFPGFEFSAETTAAFSADSHTLYIPSAKTNEIIAYDVENLAVRARIPTGQQPTQVSVSPDGAVITSLDLGSNTLSLIAVNPHPLYVPHLTQTPTDYSGIAVANFGSDSANIALWARDNSGRVLPGRTNPRILTIPPGQQNAQVLSQLFGFDSGTLEGYVDAYTSSNAVAGLYLTGKIDQSRLDGVLIDSTVSKIIGFPRIIELVSKFGSQTTTEIILENPGNVDANLTLRLFGSHPLEGPGRLLGSRTLSLAAHNRIRSRISELIATGFYPMERGYLEVSADAGPIKGLALISIGDSLAAIPAIPRGLPDTTFVAAQFASGGAGVLGTPIFSNLSLTNTTEEPIKVTAKVTDAAGEIVPPAGTTVVRTLAPYETISGGAEEIFGFPDPLVDPALYEGTLRIDADKRGLMADLLYGDARNGKYLASASLHSQPGTEFGLTHIAEGRFGSPSKGLFTGIAMYNSGRSATQVTVEAYAPNGALLGRASLALDQGARIARTLGQLIPSISQQNGGTLKIKSDFPISVFEVFGGSESEFLVSVEPVVLAH